MMMTDDVKRAAVYARISRKDQSDFSLDVQLDRCRAQVEAKGWTVVGEYVDNGRSGLTMNRPGMDDMLTAVRAGELDAVVTLDVSRFGRTASGITKAVSLLREHGCEFVSVNDGLDSSTVSGRMVITILAAVAQADSEYKGERISDALAARAEEHTHVTGRLPFAYRKATDGAITVDPAEADVVRAIHALRRGGGSLAGVADAVNEDGGAGRTWHPASVKRVLDDPRYRGDVDGWPAILEADGG